MNPAFTLFEYFPSGGLQLDSLQIAVHLVGYEHEFSFRTRPWEGKVPGGIQINLVPVRAWTNVGRDEAFIHSVADRSGSVGGAIGFNKLPGLKVYYAGNPGHPQRGRKRGVLYRVMHRNRLRVEWERRGSGWTNHETRPLKV